MMTAAANWVAHVSLGKIRTRAKTAWHGLKFRFDVICMMPAKALTARFNLL
jgi:hypothetical protein